MDDEKCDIDVDIMYILQRKLPKIHSPEKRLSECDFMPTPMRPRAIPCTIVTIRNGMPIKKHSSASARLRMYAFVTVFILL